MCFLHYTIRLLHIVKERDRARRRGPHHSDQCGKITSFGPFRMNYRHPDPLQPTSTLRFSLLPDFWRDTCTGKCPKSSKQSTRIYQTHCDCVRAECSRLASASDSVSGHWKRPRRESLGQSCAGKENQKPRCAENSLDEENNFQRASKRQATSC